MGSNGDNSPFDHALRIWAVSTLLLFGVTLGVGTAALIIRADDPAVFAPNQDIAVSTYTGSVHALFAFQEDFYQKAFEYASDTVAPSAKVYGAVINHHLLAPHLIAETLSSIDAEPDTVILLSPNHFGIGSGNLITSSYAWTSPVGMSVPDTQVQHDMSDIVVDDPRIFPQEHGISGIMPFVTYAFPDAAVVPIAIRGNTPEKTLQELVEKISSIKDKRILVIASVDFSHELTKLQAEFHDRHSRAILETLETSDLQRMDADSPESLFVLMESMKALQARTFTLIRNSNAAEIIGDAEMEDVTSYITGTYSLGEGKSTADVSLLITGDMMLDRYVRQAIDAHGFEYYFSQDPRFWRGSDMSLTNLEGCFTDFTPQSLDGDNLLFTFDPALLPTLRRYAFTHFSLANNHTNNYGDAGLTQCRQYITEAGLSYVGSPRNTENTSTMIEIRGKTIAIYAVNNLANTSPDTYVDDIASLKKSANSIIVFVHWGNEYQSDASSSQQTLAHALIDAGADVIVGTHPHVIQGVEEYHGAYIFYSLGNFIFDQTFSEETQIGLALGVVIEENGESFYLFPISNTGFQLHFPPNEARATLLSELARKSEVSPSVREQIEQGFITN